MSKMSKGMSEEGVLLQGAPDADIGVAQPAKRPTQVLTLDLPNGTLEEIVKAGYGAGKGLQLSMGRHVSIQYGTTSYELSSGNEQFRHEIYQASSLADGASLFRGLATHKLEVRKAEEVTAGADAAMLKLQSTMAALDKEKKSNQTMFVPDSSKLPPATSRRAAAKAQKASPGLFRPNKAGKAALLNVNKTKSVQNSPLLGASKSPTHLTPSLAGTPVQLADDKTKALRTPLIHLLAMRPASVKILVKNTHAPKELVKALLDKLGRQAQGDEWRLIDRAYKELDVWKFRYPSQQDRQAAIDNAVSAFDRQRLSKSDSLWQMLLPKEERGKGKVLSKLHHLHEGPMMLKNNTPAIKVHKTESANLSPNEEAVNGATSEGEANSTARPQSQAKKGGSSSSDSLKKRLLSRSKNAKGARSPAPAKKESKSPNKEPKGKFKSAEKIIDSDEDIDLDELSQEVVTQKDRHEEAETTKKVDDSNGKKAAVESPGHKRKRSSNDEDTPRKMEKKETNGPKQVNGTTASKPSAEAEKTKKSQPPAARKSSTSPSKPSPLGSSPPTNASDIESDHRNTTPSRSSPRPIKRDATPTPTSSRPIKSSKGQTEPHSSTPTSAKRKAPQPEAATTSAKRHQTQPINSTIPRPSADGAAGLSSNSSSSGSPRGYSQTLTTARRFKDYYSRYSRLHEELSKQSQPPEHKVSHLRKMHERLKSMKMGIFHAVLPV